MRNMLGCGDRWTRFAWIAAVSMLTLAACAPASPPAEEAAPPPVTSGASSEADRSAVIAAHKDFVAAYEKGEVEAISDLLDPTPELLIFHPYLENRFDGVEETRESVARMFARMGQATWTEVYPTVLVNGNVGWVTYNVLVKAPNLPSPFVGRGSEVWVRRADGWKLTHAHWSEHADLAGGPRKG